MIIEAWKLFVDGLYTISLLTATLAGVLGLLWLTVDPNVYWWIRRPIQIVWAILVVMGAGALGR